MLNNIFSSLWMIYPSAQAALDKIIATALANIPENAEIVPPVSAGTVDDAARMGLPVQRVGRSALVRTVGPMIKSAGWMAKYGIAGTRETQAALQSAAVDPDVDAIVWLMDTPGGSVDGLEELAGTARAVKSKKPVIVQVDGLLASAGYYVAAQASKIYAAPGNLVGSIGTRIALYDYSGLYEKAGVKAVPVDTGEHKSAGLPGTKITESQIAQFQKIVDGYFEMFLGAIEVGRNMDRKSIEKLADGRVYFATESVESGLIDGEQTLSQTLAELSVNEQASNRRRTRADRLRVLQLASA
ncbi:S49 family peptidase [Teredinibacter turnerae]|uniref:S49 family peptidase n=1 Tax=Teredinibacter turnerae TaxID=2426 RepID=UPI0030D493D0